MRPSVGRIVHYVSYGTPGPVVGLCVLNPTGLFFHAIADGGCRQDEDGKAGGTWHWPERVEES
ncbi:MAG TPA: hypothetical protein VG276_27995 [Actinomycetes bacterium]|jgi:hypothetical protein|nr:hypothetical protein [Actinomycetes bacterium]